MPVNKLGGEQTTSYDFAMRSGVEARKHGDFNRALHDFELAVRLASSAHNVHDEVVAMNREAGAFIRLYQYRQALAIANSALDLATTIRDQELIGIANNNRAAVYQQLGDYRLAENAAHDAVSSLANIGNHRYYASALTNYGDILALSGQPGAAMAQFRQAIEIAAASHLPDVEALAQDRAGEYLLETQDASCGVALKRAYDLFLAEGDRTDAAMSLFNLAAWQRWQGQYADALRTLDKAKAAGGLTVGGQAPYFEPQLRGQCLLGLHRKQEALAQFERAVRLAREWRRSSLPSDTSSTKTLVALHQVYEDYIQLAAGLSIRNKDAALSRKALGVLMENRASTLREQMVAALGRQMTLPPSYFEILNEIQAAQAAVTLGAAKDVAAKRLSLQRLQTRLTEVENAVGLDSRIEAVNGAESASLYKIQRKLTRSELLLSFFLGKENSYVWAIANDKVSVYELPAESTITSHARAFTAAAHQGNPVATGQQLARDLLGQIDPTLASRSEWLIAADGALVDSVPFSALPETAASSKPLSASHSLRSTPSELLLAQPSTAANSDRFVGVADPIYNFADSRITPTQAQLRTKTRPKARITLARLISSERELQHASRNTGFSQVELLTGAGATPQVLREKLQAPPEVLHFAVHVISPQGVDGTQGEEAGLALTLGQDGLPQLLTKEFISTLRVPGTLVVLSGCASQQGKALPSAGLLGLSRAWLLAGASAVLVTAWPMPDDSGQFFSSFYGHLQGQPKTSNLARRAAAALQATQNEMQHSTDYMSGSPYWAAYSLISKE